MLWVTHENWIECYLFEETWYSKRQNKDIRLYLEQLRRSDFIHYYLVYAFK